MTRAVLFRRQEEGDWVLGTGYWVLVIGLPREIPGRDSVAYFTGVIWLRRHLVVIR